MDSSGQETVLVVRTGARVCALPLKNVEEVMRPLPTNLLPGMPPFLLGLAIIRGAPVPVVDLRKLLGIQDLAEASRFVVCRLNGRRVALAADAVAGLREVESSQLNGLMPIVEESNPALVEAVGVSDQQLLFVLQVARIIPDNLWAEFESVAAAP